MSLRFLPALALVFGLALTAAAETADLYVATNGNDGWSGRLPAPEGSDGPLATVAAAQKKVREILAKEPQRQKAIVVAIRSGTYYLAAPLVFEPGDSGTPAAPIVYRAYENEAPVLSGGRTIAGWKVVDGRWQAQLDDVKSGQWQFSQLFVDNQRRFRPRLPKTGYYNIAEAVPPSEKAGGGADRFGFSEGQLRPDWANLGDVEVLAMHSWSMSRMRIGAIDPQKRIVTFTGSTPTKDWWGSFPKGHRFLVENVREALGEPGQWYLDRPSGVLTYIPRPGETIDKTAAIAPRLEQLVLFVGKPRQKQTVHDLKFAGLRFAHTNYVLPDKGHSCPQAEVDVAAAIAGVGMHNIALDRCAIVHTGGYAVALGYGCQNNRLENCELVDLGAGGVMLGEAGPGPWDRTAWSPNEPATLASDNTVRNCAIAHGGRLHPAAVGVWIGHSPRNKIVQNDIFDLYYTAVSVGWVWGYSPSAATHNEIGKNHMHTIGQGVLSDMGGVYTLGVSPGTTVHDNHIHDVQSFDYGGWGLYTDEGSTGIVMENNLVYRTRTGGFHQHYGKENRIQNNIFVDGTLHQIQRTRNEPHLSFWFERNIVYWHKGPLLGSNWNDNNFKLDGNCYWNAAGQPVVFPGDLKLDQWRAKRQQDERSVVADPLFVAPDKDDYHLRPDSPALKLGFKPFDYTTAGRTSPAEMTKDLPAVPRAFDSPDRKE